jgi:chemotaxis protein histidine kinase CheA
VRALAGIARLGEHPRLHSAATVVAGAMRNNASLADEDRMQETLADFRAFLEETEPSDELDGRLASLRTRWGVADDGDAALDASADPQFFSWVAEETSAIADCMDAGVQAFMNDPSDRDELGTILRRQRPLLGAARLAGVSVVGETLHAVEDLSAMIVRLDVPIKVEWLDVFRSARDVLRAASARLARGEQPEPVNALSRLRTLRSELMDRYGARVASSAAAPSAADGEAVPLEARPYTSVSADVEPVPAAADLDDASAPAEVDGVESLLARARALRPVIEAGSDRAARAALAELYEILTESLS